MSTKKALKWVAFWIGLALAFNAGIYLFMGKESALEFLGGFVIEKSLSIDNLFLFIMVFSSFGIKQEYQRRILNYGIIGALILRLIFVLLGVTIVNMFHWILYVFGAILIISGVRMIFKNEENDSVKDSKIIKVLGKIIPVTDKVEGDKFFVRKNKILHATPLFAVLILIEFTDIIFAVDSIPAIFSAMLSPLNALMGMKFIGFILILLRNSVNSSVIELKTSPLKFTKSILLTKTTTCLIPSIETMCP